MRATGFSLQIPLSDVGFILFGKKTCPVCHGKLAKHMAREYVKGREIERSIQDDMIFGDNQTVLKETYMYKCGECGHIFSIPELK